MHDKFWFLERQKNTMNYVIKLLVLLVCISTSVGFVPAYAGEFMINPLRATFSDTKKVSSLTVTNRSSKPTTIQLDVMAWSQDAEGKDVLVPTKDILANPPIFTLQPKSKQIIRVGLRRPPNATQETTYRLILAETPPPLDPDFTGVNFAVRMSVPLFVLPKAKVAPELQWVLKRDGTGLKLMAHNTGTAHSQVISFKLINPETKLEYITQAVSSYLLPQQQREWSILEQKIDVGSTVRLLVQTDGVKIEQDLQVQ